MRNGSERFSIRTRALQFSLGPGAVFALSRLISEGTGDGAHHAHASAALKTAPNFAGSTKRYWIPASSITWRTFPHGRSQAMAR